VSDTGKPENETGNDRLTPNEGVFAPFNFPTTYADGILSIAGGFPITRMFLYRIEPNMFGTGGLQTVPTAQIVMPLDGVLNLKLFIDSFINNLIQTNQLTAEQFEKFKSEFKQPTFTLPPKTES
jgi:hypothetical protein